MNPIFKTGFEALPFELCRLITEETESSSDLCALTLVSKHCYAAFNYSLYEEITSAALFTLGLTEKARLPLTGPHPASYVKSMVFDLLDDEARTYVLGGGPFQRNGITSKRKKQQQEKKSLDPNTLQKLFTAAVSNIMFYAPRASINSLYYDCKALSLPQVFGNINPAVFSLTDLSLGFHVLNTNSRKTMATIESLLSASLTYLDLNFLEHGEPDLFVLAKILRKTQSNCPNLKKLCFNSPSSWLPPTKKSAQPIQAVFNEHTFILPRLESLCLTGYDESHMILEDCVPFLTRHPHITDFEFAQADGISPPAVASSCTESILSNLVRLKGSANDCVALCGTGTRPVETIVLTTEVRSACTVGSDALVLALQNTKTLKRLFIHDLRFFTGGEWVGLEIHLLRNIASACPALTHFQCALEVEGEHAILMLQLVYAIIAAKLRHLRHFKISICVGDVALTEESGPEWNSKVRDPSHPLYDLYKATIEELDTAVPRHPVLETAQIRLLGRPVEWSTEPWRPFLVAAVYIVRSRADASDAQGGFVEAGVCDRMEFQMDEFREYGSS
ncbi:hypothetical protein BDP27DRAFT_1323529 [Rhodocollybia butyracea]|uniref:Uncharacterized protein n=1 Tax=Rhodocollybia butyracea TaxID=206335 RepID=A0A9P5PWC1_9AGAR|nr:hypothetical protein BDP27DRAFT_1323529 [Rhodocollybia butyracea]